MPRARASHSTHNRRERASLQHVTISAPRKRRYSRWRVCSLILVHVLIALHIMHWKLAGRTLAPLELNEVMYTLELGIVTAGFIFMSLAVLSVLFFGRFFCSWGCHILALQDLCAWILGKFGIRPKPVRSRVLLFVPFGAMFYMFIWPQVSRLLAGEPLPRLQVYSDAQGWASFVTNDFWRNLPGPGIALLTFAICGFAIVYILGSRGFCTYACPYGAVFSLADRFAPGKIMAAGDPHDCTSCGLCTAVCESHIRVHEEVIAFGKVVSPACLKDLDCVEVCPNGSIKYGFTMPALFKSWRKYGRFGVPYDFTLAEDMLIAAAFICTLFVFRGLYDLVPFLLTLGAGAILGFGSVLVLRLRTRRDLRLNPFQLKRTGRITPAGWCFVAIAGLIALFVAHCAFIRFHEIAGQSHYNKLAHLMTSNADPGETATAQHIQQTLYHLETCKKWGLVWPPELMQRLATVHLWRGLPGAAASERYIRRLLEQQPMAHDWRITLAVALLMQNRPDEACEHLRQLIAMDAAAPNAPQPHQREVAHSMLQQITEAIRSTQGTRHPLYPGK